MTLVAAGAGGVWDTKHLARELPQLFRGRSTSLGDVYAALLGGGMRAEVSHTMKYPRDYAFLVQVFTPASSAPFAAAHRAKAALAPLLHASGRWSIL